MAIPVRLHELYEAISVLLLEVELLKIGIFSWRLLVTQNGYKLPDG
jgi:hypothetical protein